MSDLSDFKRLCHEPLKQRCEQLQAQNKALVEALKSVNLVLKYTDYRAGLNYAAALNIEVIVNAALEQEAQ